jgi:hypothetical protein
MSDVSGAYDDSDPVGPTDVAAAPDAAPQAVPEQTEAEKANVNKILAKIKRDQTHFKDAFERMKADMHMAMYGCDADWPKKNYRAPIVGRHISQKTASLYAKNPKIVARRKEMLDFTVWDETPESLMTAMAEVQKAEAALQQVSQMPPTPPMVDEATGQPMPAPAEAAQAAIMQHPVLQQAQAIIADVQQGMARRQLLKKFGKSLELVYAHSMRVQTPLDFKSGMKSVVRRACTAGVGYVEIGFQREFGIPPDVQNELDDARDRLNHLERLSKEVAEGEIGESDAEMDELNKAIADLEAKPQVAIRSGLTFKWHQATHVIPDKHCTHLGGFLGGKHLTVKEVISKKDAEERFKTDLGSEYTPYKAKDKDDGKEKGVDTGDNDYEAVAGTDKSDDDMVCILKHWDKRSGLVYWLCEGHSKFLTPPASPDCVVPRFWPVYSLTFNPVESESELFGLSDVALLRDVQNEINRSRQGKREHRAAARPRFVYGNGTFDPDKDLPLLETMAAFEMVGISGDPTIDIAKKLQAFPMPGVDPNLYDTNEVMQDGLLAAGVAASQLGGTSKSTATEAAIADGAMSTSDGSAVDDLDALLTAMARDGGMILQVEMPKEEVVRIVGPGAVWVDDLVEQLGMQPEDIYDEIYLEIEAGSSGKPNQPQEIRNFKELGPLIMQIPGVNPEKFAKEAIRRLDDRMDLNEWIVPGLQAMVAMNRAQPAPPGEDPGKSDPAQQGDKGGDNGPKPSESAGTPPAFGSNQV